mgnify:CR=1 FL=1
MRRAGWVIAVLMVLGTPTAWAARTSVHEAAESQDYGRKFGGMSGRGVLNVVTSPVDILTNTVNETKAGPPLVGTLTGVAKGLGCGILRLGSGAVDLVTFWVPGFNGFPVSDSYDSCTVVGSSPAPAAKMQAPSAGPDASAAPWSPPPMEPAPRVSQKPAPTSQKPAKKRWTK